MCNFTQSYGIDTETNRNLDQGRARANEDQISLSTDRESNHGADHALSGWRKNDDGLDEGQHRDSQKIHGGADASDQGNQAIPRDFDHSPKESGISIKEFSKEIYSTADHIDANAGPDIGGDELFRMGYESKIHDRINEVGRGTTGSLQQASSAEKILTEIEKEVAPPNAQELALEALVAEIPVAAIAVKVAQVAKQAMAKEKEQDKGPELSRSL
jgi:hypothetical protein